MELRPDADTMSLDGRSGSATIVGLTAEQARHVHYFYVAPNLLIALHPDFILTHRLTPQAPGLTEVECEWLFAPSAVEQPGFDPSYAVDFWDLTNRQDFGACESVYRGIVGGGYEPGLFDDLERGSHAFQAQVAQSYLAGEWVQASHELIGL
jgi:Rieske 2Fe-2S family protein